MQSIDYSKLSRPALESLRNTAQLHLMFLEPQLETEAYIRRVHTRVMPVGVRRTFEGMMKALHRNINRYTIQFREAEEALRSLESENHNVNAEAASTADTPEHRLRRERGEASARDLGPGE